MNWKAAIDYLDKQSKFCHNQYAESLGSNQHFALLADIYAVMAQALLVAQCPSVHDFPPHARD